VSESLQKVSRSKKQSITQETKEERDVVNKKLTRERDDDDFPREEMG